MSTEQPPTPRTDEHLERTRTSPGPNLWASANFARELERENEAMRAAIEEAEEAFLTFNDVGNCKAFHDAKDKALAALKPFLRSA